MEVFDVYVGDDSASAEDEGGALLAAATLQREARERLDSYYARAPEATIYYEGQYVLTVDGRYA